MTKPIKNIVFVVSFLPETQENLTKIGKAQDFCGQPLQDLGKLKFSIELAFFTLWDEGSKSLSFALSKQNLNQIYRFSVN